MKPIGLNSPNLRHLISLAALSTALCGARQRRAKPGVSKDVGLHGRRPAAILETHRCCDALSVDEVAGGCRSDSNFTIAE